MDKPDIDELQDPETWDNDTAQVLSPSESPKVVVPVSFTPTEFASLSRFARDHGVTTSECIRDAILDRIEKVGLAKRAGARS
jgi:hypothetical protein